MNETDRAVRDWYRGYVDTFIGLASGARDDLQALVKLYEVPCTYTTDAAHVVLGDEIAVAGALRAEIDGLRQAHYAGSALLRLDVNVLNLRAALVEAVWSREDRAGKELVRFSGAYLVVRTPAGWRFTAIIISPP